MWTLPTSCSLRYLGHAHTRAHTHANTAPSQPRSSQDRAMKITEPGTRAHTPVGELLGGQVLAVALVGDVVVLAEDAAQVAHAEEDGAAAVVALHAGLLAKVRRDDVHLGRLGADQAHARRLVAVDAAPARAQVAVAQVRVRRRPLLGRVDRAQHLVPRRVVVEQEGRRQVQRPRAPPPGPAATWTWERANRPGRAAHRRRHRRPAQQSHHCVHVGIISVDWARALRSDRHDSMVGTRFQVSVWEDSDREESDIEGRRRLRAVESLV